MKTKEMLAILQKLGTVNLSYPVYDNRTTKASISSGGASYVIRDVALTKIYNKASADRSNWIEVKQPYRHWKEKPELTEQRKATYITLAVQEKNRSAAIKALFDLATNPNHIIEKAVESEGDAWSGLNSYTEYSHSRYSPEQKDWSPVKFQN